MTTPHDDEVDGSAESQVSHDLGTGEAVFGSAQNRSKATAGERWAAYAAAHPNSKRAKTLRALRELEERAIDLPIIGKFHTPDKHDAVYIAALAALLALGAVELPIALAVLGGHVFVKQHSSRSISAIGEVLEDVWGSPGTTGGR